ncbi:hypothetical protein CHUAL_003656 [Chamberlinius hualienensis]
MPNENDNFKSNAEPEDLLPLKKENEESGSSQEPKVVPKVENELSGKDALPKVGTLDEKELDLRLPKRFDKKPRKKNYVDIAIPTKPLYIMTLDSFGRLVSDNVKDLNQQSVNQQLWLQRPKSDGWLHDVSLENNACDDDLIMEASKLEESFSDSLKFSSNYFTSEISSSSDPVGQNKANEQLLGAACAGLPEAVDAASSPVDCSYGAVGGRPPKDYGTNAVDNMVENWFSADCSGLKEKEYIGAVGGRQPEGRRIGAIDKIDEGWLGAVGGRQPEGHEIGAIDKIDEDWLGAVGGQEVTDLDAVGVNPIKKWRTVWKLNSDRDDNELSKIILDINEHTVNIFTLRTELEFQDLYEDKELIKKLCKYVNRACWAKMKLTTSLIENIEQDVVNEVELNGLLSTLECFERLSLSNLNNLKCLLTITLRCLQITVVDCIKAGPGELENNGLEMPILINMLDEMCDESQ